SIETSQSEDGRFSYQDQCPECSSQGVVPASPADILAAVRTLPGVRETWMCEYPEFNDPACYAGHPDPKPEDAHPASKHLDCRWVLVVPLSPRTTNPYTFSSSPPDLDRLREAVGTV